MFAYLWYIYKYYTKSIKITFNHIFYQPCLKYLYSFNIPFSNFKIFYACTGQLRTINTPIKQILKQFQSFKMKFVFVLLSFVVFTYAGPITFGTGKQVTIDEDGTITVTSGTGKRIVITKAIGHPGPKDIEITVGGPLGPTKKIEIDGESQTRTVDIMDNEYENLNEEDREKRSSAKESKSGKSKSKKSQSDVLSKIFKQYEGVVDAESYNELLANVNNSVQNGELNPAVYDVLQSLNQYRLAEKYGNQGYLTAKGYSSGNQGYLTAKGYPSGNQFQSQLPLQQERWVSGQMYNYGQFPLSQQQSVSEQQLQQQFQQQLQQEQVQQLQQLQQLHQQVQLQQQLQQQQQPRFNPSGSQLRSVVEQLVNPWY